MIRACQVRWLRDLSKGGAAVFPRGYQELRWLHRRGYIRQAGVYCIVITQAGREALQRHNDDVNRHLRCWQARQVKEKARPARS